MVSSWVGMPQNARVINSSRGRPAGGSDARDRLANAAAELFVTQGYAATSARQVARDAGVSHSLVNYYFGSKEGLFAHVMEIHLRPSAVIEQAFSRRDLGPLDQARHVIATALGVWDQPEVRGSLLGLLSGAMGDEALRTSIAEFFADEIFGHIRTQLAAADVRDVSRRSAAVAGVMAGLIFTRYVLQVQPIAAMSVHDVMRTFAPSIAVQLR